MSDYYSKNLSGLRLRQCYELAPPRIEQYLVEEAMYAMKHILPTDIVLETGCGYGRLMSVFSMQAKTTYGIDTSEESLWLGKEFLKKYKNCVLLNMDAAAMDFPKEKFDVVLCLQNGISAFKRDPGVLIQECMRVAQPGGKILFSTYSRKFWKHRLEWFRSQSAAGLLGEIDERKTKKGVIVCKDGFVSTSYSEKDFRELTKNLQARIEITEVDESSLFCIIEKPQKKE